MKRSELSAPDDCRFFRIRSASEMLGISEGHAYRLIANNRLQVHHFGRATRVSLWAIRRYIANSRGKCLDPLNHFRRSELDGAEAEPTRPPDDCVFYRISELEDLLQVTRRHVHRLIKSRALRCDRFGRATRVSLAALRQYLADTVVSIQDSHQ
jgi:excisionase family DNA binding protein